MSNKIKITFFSNYLTHHQLPFCDYLFNDSRIDFTFVATKEIPKERIDLGYENLNIKYNFVLEEYANSNNKSLAEMLSKTSDVVIYGSAPMEYYINATKNNKVVFKYSERLFKEGLKNWKTIIKYIRALFKYRKGNSKAYLLSASAYTPLDYSFVSKFKSNGYKWGYFPYFNELDFNDIVSFKNNDKMTITWVGRLIDWKNPSYAIELAKKLQDKNYDFDMNIIGTGPEYNHIKNMILEYDLRTVNLIGSVPSKEVEEHLLKSNIFIFTSNFGEGWGAVLNEAMSCGCAVVASHAIGSVPYLLNNKNGLIFENENIDDLVNKVVFLLENKDERTKIGKEAYYTIKNLWNPNLASDRFINICQELLNNNIIYFDEGPLSEAIVISESFNKI